MAWMKDVAFLPNSTTMVSLNINGIISLWEVRLIAPHHQAVNAVHARPASGRRSDVDMANFAFSLGNVGSCL